MSAGPQIVSDTAMREIETAKSGLQRRVIFAEEFSDGQFLEVIVTGVWDEDMAEALRNFMERRKSVTPEQTK
jgi:hypothetical protein